ncbi:alpha/beta hydrolase [uncultured Williamsia sp.]|uniref:alpha/beta fold hydrolase n=1 Tax=uncultured Williamsia sp. TaxID=259311 RepID=UPI00262C27D9|nr:alpha/beta hydrolase [uncultured Williamsia sp.]
MATFVLIPGAGSDPRYWRFVVDALSDLGHRCVAIDLPCDDDDAGLAEYVDAAVAQTPDDVDTPVVVAHSFGGFTGPLLAERLGASALVFAQAMIPRPGERPGDWWHDTGAEAHQARAAREGGWDLEDIDGLFYNGVPPEVVATEVERRQSDTPSELPWPGAALPDVPTRFLIFRDDRFFPESLIREVVADRLPGVVPDEVPGGHMAMLSHPSEIAGYLDSLVNR